MVRDQRSGERAVDDVPRCERHGARTRLTCVDCGTPICPKCMTRTAVGLKCEVHAAPGAPVPTKGSSRSLLVAGVVVVAGVAAAAAALVFAREVGDGAGVDRSPRPILGTWSKAPALQAVRGSTTAVATPEGRVAVIGGGIGAAPIAAVEIFDPDAGRWSRSGDLVEARRGHQAVLLADGRILVAGGIARGRLLATAEIFDPETGRSTVTRPMAGPRLGHTMTLLTDGSVLVTGGTGEGEAAGGGSQSVAPMATAEVFDPASGRWSTVGAMNAARFEHTATALPDGRVLVAGGMGLESGSLAALDSAELYDPSTRAFSRAGAMLRGRANHAAVVLDDGRVLAVAGDGGTAPLAAAEIYDVSRGSWSEAGSLANARRGHTATVLPDGAVLVAGGEFFDQGTRTSLASAELFRPGSGDWASAGNMDCPRSEHSAALLPDGTVLVAGGDAAFPGKPPVAQSCADLYRR